MFCLYVAGILIESTLRRNITSGKCPLPADVRQQRNRGIFKTLIILAGDARICAATKSET